MTSFPLPPGQIHVFYTRADQISDLPLLKQYKDYLSLEELQKADRYLKPADRHLSLVSKALVRYLLSGVTALEPQLLDFSVNEYGKPFLSGWPDIHFNLSHSHGAAVCALCRGTAVGVDLEDVERRMDLAVAKRFFCSWETELLSQVADAEKRKLFFDIWTLKEAYVKAVGRGLSLALDSFSFNVGEPVVQITFSDTGRTDPLWQFFQWRPEPGKIVAAAVRSPCPISATYSLCIPFVGIYPLC